ncbi:MAG: MFS transporter [Clostridium sp.]|uniref:MFS transporter n=1 Tax=Clostridium sp. TaxID=1506 RepID=UPI001E0B6558|nr:MFS transporter [Clostridium sp.]MBS5928140.1 MFS transporter [Clostridium sp.]MBS5985393.1 MFS transporter [Clostridium sp.]
MRSKSLKTVTVLTALTYIVLNMAHPVTPMFITQNKLPSYLFGVFFAAMSIGNFIFSPIWGRLSDKGGRIKFMILGILGYGISQVGFGFSSNTVIIVFWRFIGGASVISFLTVILAYIADITDEEGRLKGMTYYAAASTFGGAIGSLLGGVIGNNNYKITFSVQFVLSIVICILFYLFLEETVTNKNIEKVEKEKMYSKSINSLNPKVIFIMSQVVVFFFAVTSYNSSINYYIESVLSLPPTVNGIFLAIAGIFGFLINIFFTGKLAKRFGEVKALRISGISMALCIGGATLFNLVPLFFLFILLFVGSSAVYQPMLQNIISKVSNKDNGKIAGIQNSARAIGMIIGSLYSGFIFAYGSKLPFLTASIVILLGYLIFKLGYKKYEII